MHSPTALRHRTVIVDDEPPARIILREFLAPHYEIDIVGECANGFEAVKAITELRPDLVFLDVQMPKLNGFEVLELVDYKPTVVFATAYDSYAIQAFEIHAVDYLLKPFSRERMEEALSRAIEQIRQKQTLPFARVAEAARKHDLPLQRILVREGTRVHIIPVEAVDHIEAQDDYVAISSGGKRHLKLQRLEHLVKNLDSQRFVRIHRSHVLNVERLARIELYAKDSRVAILKDGTKLPVSRAGYRLLRRFL